MKQAFETLINKAGFNPLTTIVSRVNVIVTLPASQNLKAEALKVLLASAGLKDARSFESYDGDCRPFQKVVRVTANW